VPKRKQARKPSHLTWGHWILLCLVLSGLAAALLIQRANALGAPLADAGKPAGVSLAGPVLSSFGGQPGTLAAQPGTVSLIFEGGHDRAVTSRIVSALHIFGVPATFFIRDDDVTASRAIISREVSGHNEIGITPLTGAALARLPAWRVNAELAATQRALQVAGAPATALASPPGATTVQDLTVGVWAAARRLQDLGYVVVLADREAETITSPAGILNALQPAWSSDAGRRGIVLAMSDSGPPGNAALAALPQMITGLQSAGYRFTTITRGFDVTVGQARTSRVTAAGESAVLIAARVSVVVAAILRWSFLATAGIVGARLILLVIAATRYRARSRRPRRPWRGPVSVIVPAYNEHAGIERCLRSMVGSDYPELEVILVDDGSTDATPDLVAALGLPVVVVRQANKGKATALNTGVRHARHSVLIFADGDTIFERATIAELVAPFADPRVGAVAGNVKVANRRSLLGMIQHVEYVVGSSLDRCMYDVLSCMVTIPGAVGAFRRSAITDVGGVPSNTLAEDSDLTIAIGCAGWRVRYAAAAPAWTEAPATVAQLWTQRHRWSYGTMQALWKYRRILLAPHGSRRLAWVGLPYMFVISCVLPLISPAGDLYILFNAWASPWHAVRLLAMLLATQGTLTAWAIAFDRERLRCLWTVLFQQVFYRQLLYLVTIHSVATAVTGVRLRWHKLARIGVQVRLR